VARQAEAVKLRVAGHTIREIAVKLGVSTGQAHADLRTAMNAIAVEAEENVRAERGLELGRLERAFQVIEDVLLDPEPTAPDAGEEAFDFEQRVESSRELKLKALDRLMKAQDQRSKLLGLYAPTKSEVDAKVASVGLDEIDERRKAAAKNEADVVESGD
jgi:hypothetical protein